MSTNKTDALCKFVLRQLGAGRALTELQRQQILAAGVDLDRLIAETVVPEAGSSLAPAVCPAPESGAEVTSDSDPGSASKRQRHS
jgi:hypothetical protein